MAKEVKTTIPNKHEKETNNSSTKTNENNNIKSISLSMNTNINTNNNIKSNQTKNQQEELHEAKLKELEQEIQLLKSENECVANLKEEYQRLYMELNIEIDNFYVKKDLDLKEFEKWKEEEIRKIQKEKKAGEAKSGRLNQNIIPSKKDKDEIECLKNIIAKMQEEFKIKDNNNKLTIEKYKRKLEESNSKVIELNKTIEDFHQKNMLMRSNSTNVIKMSNVHYANLAAAGAASSNSNSNVSNNNSNNKKIINYNEANIINDINNHSTFISPSTQGLLSRNIEEPNSGKAYKSINSQQINSALSASANLVNNINLNSNGNNALLEINKQKTGKPQRLSEDQIKIAAKQLLPKKNSKEIFNTKSNNNINNRSIELVKKLSNESYPEVKLKNNSTQNDIITDSNMLYNIHDDGVYDLVFLEKYHPRNDLNASVVRHENFTDGKIVKFYDNDKREVIFPSGVRKEIFADGYQIVYFNNKDIKQVI
jgi:hypothetical protein